MLEFFSVEISFQYGAKFQVLGANPSHWIESEEKHAFISQTRIVSLETCTHSRENARTGSRELSKICRDELLIVRD